MTRGVLPILMSVILTAGTAPLSFAAPESQLNFKIYSPDSQTATPAPDAADAAAVAGSTGGATSDPAADVAADKPTEKPADAASEVLTKEVPELSPTPAAVESKPADQTSQATGTGSTDAATTAETMTPTTTDTKAADSTATTAADSKTAADTTAAAENKAADATTTTDTKAASETATADPEKKVLQGYIRVVPTGTKVPIIMDTAVDSDTSQENDEFAARTAEDLTIDGAIVVPAGSIIKGRIACLNAPKHLNRSGSVQLKFDTVTTPDNRQIPLVANLVARGGVVHAKRGLKDVAMDTGIVSLPFLAGAVIGAFAGGTSSSSTGSTTSTGTTTNSSNKIGHAGGAMIGAGVGLAVGVAILLAKRGKKVDVRPGDELKIELAEDLRMPMM